MIFSLLIKVVQLYQNLTDTEPRQDFEAQPQCHPPQQGSHLKLATSTQRHTTTSLGSLPGPLHHLIKEELVRKVCIRKGVLDHICGLSEEINYLF